MKKYAYHNGWLVCMVIYHHNGSLESIKDHLKSWEPKVPPPKATPQEIAGPNSRPKIKGNQWVFIVPGHKALLFIGGKRSFGGGVP